MLLVILLFSLLIIALNSVQVFAWPSALQCCDLSAVPETQFNVISAAPSSHFHSSLLYDYPDLCYRVI